MCLTAQSGALFARSLRARRSTQGFAPRPSAESHTLLAVHDGPHPAVASSALRAIAFAKAQNYAAATLERNH